MSEKDLNYIGFIKTVIDALHAAGIEYLIGGAVAAWAWGEPRATLDIDLVVNIPIETIGRLSKELEKRAMLVPPDIILDAILEERTDLPINAIHMYTGYKADLYPVRDHDELRLSAFQRRRLIDLGPQLGEVYLHSPEDLIVYKLWYYSLSQQTKHLRDITAIVLTQDSELDISYVENWANRKGLSTLWKELYARIQLNRTP